MATTDKWLLEKPERGYLFWDVPLNINFDTIDTILYKLRTNFKNTDGTSDNSETGTTWYDSINSVLKLRIPSGLKEILTTESGDLRYFKVGSTNAITGNQNFTNGSINFFNQFTSASAKIYFGLYETTKNWLTFEFGNIPGESRIKFRWNGTDNIYDVMDVMNTGLLMYKNIKYYNTTTTSPASTYYYNDTNNYGIRVDNNKFRIYKNIGETGETVLFDIDSTGTVKINNTDTLITSANISSQTVGTANNANKLSNYNASKTPAANEIPVLNQNSELTLPAANHTIAGNTILHSGNAIQILSQNADTVDNLHAASTPTPNYLLALNAQSKLPTSITGDSVTCSGYTPSQLASASAIVTRDTNGKIAGDILGNAATATLATNATNSTNATHADSSTSSDNATLAADSNKLGSQLPSFYQKKITISTSNPSGGIDGDIWFKYII